jgi:hypothetical protein
LLKQQEDCTFCKQYPILKDAKEFTVVPGSEVNLRQQDWVETNRRKVDKLSNGKLAYVWLPNTGKAATQISTVTILRQKKEPSLMSDLIMGTDCRLHHRCAFKRSSWL